MNYSRRTQLNRFLIILGILLAVLVISIPIAAGVYLSTESHIVLREAKNAKIALEMTAIEYYGRSIYDKSAAGGMAEGVWERIQPHIEENCSVTLDGYDQLHQKVTGMTYIRDRFRVTYIMDDDGNVEWEMDYFLKVQKYTELKNNFSE